MTDRLRFTEEMAEAARKSLDGLSFAFGLTSYELEQTFRAMLAAAPQEEYRQAFHNEYVKHGLRKSRGFGIRPVGRPRLSERRWDVEGITEALWRHRQKKAASQARLAEWMASE